MYASALAVTQPSPVRFELTYTRVRLRDTNWRSARKWRAITNHTSTLSGIPVRGKADLTAIVSLRRMDARLDDTTAFLHYIRGDPSLYSRLLRSEDVGLFFTQIPCRSIRTAGLCR